MQALVVLQRTNDVNILQIYDSKPRVASLLIKHEDRQRLKHLNGCMVQNSGPGILKASSLTSRSCSNEYSKPDLKSLGKWRVGGQGLRLKSKTLPLESVELHQAQISYTSDMSTRILYQ